MFLGPSGRLGATCDWVWFNVPQGPQKQIACFLHAYRAWRAGKGQACHCRQSGSSAAFLEHKTTPKWLSCKHGQQTATLRLFGNKQRQNACHASMASEANHVLPH